MMINQKNRFAKVSNIIQTTATYFLLILGVLITVFPFLWMLSTSLSPAKDVFAWPPKLLPSPIMWSNYADALKATNLLRFFLNSSIVSFTTVAIALILNSMAAYALARLEFPGRNLIFLFILGTIMIPAQVTMIPLFIMFKNFPLVGGNNLLGQGGKGLIDTYTSLILPGLASTFGVYLLREAFRMLPSELIDAARVDGASEFRIYWQIAMPLVNPSLATMALLNFTWVYNEFLWPLIMTSDANMRTIQLGLSAYKGQYFTDWHLLMAATVLSTIPVLLVYLVGQRYFIQGVVTTGLKG
jgi:multiple sugar transport system permease protein